MSHDEVLDELKTTLLFDIIKEIKQFYETPVILVTKKDFSDDLFNAMCSISSAIQNETKNQLIDQIVDFHLQWLHAVNEIDSFKKIIPGLPKDDMYQAISYTIDAMTNRLKYFQRYVEKHKSTLSNENQADILAELEIIDEMHKDVTNALLQKLKCFRNYTGDTEFQYKVSESVEELLNWIDKIYDGASINLSKYLKVNMPHLTGDLTKTLQQIIDDLHTSRSASAQKMLDEIKEKGKQLSAMLHCTAGHSLEISKVIEKINILDDRIKRMANEPTSAALMALSYKKDYLERRLLSLENLKTTLKSLHHAAEIEFEDEEDSCSCTDFYRFRIFNHVLPLEERERLVTELCYLWDLAVFGERSHKSIISILSAAEIKEEYTDELGTFYIDEYSRKIYKLPDDDTLYQPNENNQLIPLSDDKEHIYFYDECGRYFIDNKTRQRVYKAHSTASEYMMGSSGNLLKIKEERDGTTYYFDNCGRYYINNEGKHIYREADARSEYESDGLGNLVRIRSQMDIFEPCPDDVCVTDDFKYLKQLVGSALRECIADVILHQPADPIKYLSSRLVKYRENMEIKERQAIEEEELKVAREIILAEEKAAAERAALEAARFMQGGSEANNDSNVIVYNSQNPASVNASSK